MAEAFSRDARGAALCAGVQRMQSLCSGYRGEAPCWGQGAKPIGRLRAAALAQRSDACVTSYWVLSDAETGRFGSKAALPAERKLKRRRKE